MNKKYKYFLLWGILFLISAASSSKLYLNISKLFKDFALVTIIYCLFLPCVKIMNSTILKIKEKWKGTPNSSLFLELHKYNILFAVLSFGYANLVHIHSFNDIFLRLLIGFVSLIILEIILIKRKLDTDLLKKNIVKLYEKLNDERYEIETKHNILSFVLGLGFVIFGLFYLEIFVQNNYFLQDDNFTQFLPVITGAMRDFFNNGLFPEINPYQMMGLPTSSAGVYALTYPITYISYWFANSILHNEFYTINVFCWFHLILAYILAYKAARYCKVSPIFSALFGICYTLSGYNLIATRSWYYMSPIAAFAPTIIIGLEYIKNKTIGLKYILIGSLITTLLICSGNIQMFIYACTFYFSGVLILLLLKSITIKQVIKSFYPIIIGGLITLPQLYVTMDLMQSCNRIIYHSGFCKIIHFKTFILPYYLIKNIINNNDFDSYFGQIYYSGSVFCVCAALCILINIFMLLKTKVHFPKFISLNIYLILGLIALNMGFGNHSCLYTLLHSLPVYKLFQQPIKFMIFVNLFLNLTGAIFLTKIIKKKLSKIFIIILTCTLILFHLHNSYSAFFVFPNNKYNDLNFFTKNLPDIYGHRVHILAPERSKEDYFPLSLKLNFATVYKIQCLDCYNDYLETFLDDNMTLLEQMYDKGTEFVLNKDILEYGIKYLILMDYTDNEEKFSINYKNTIKPVLEKNLKFCFKYKNLNFYKLKNPKPLAFDSNIKPLPVKFNTQGAIVDISNIKTPQVITVNMLNRKYYNAYTNNKKEQITPDKYNRITVYVKNPSELLVIKYHSPWEKGFLLSLLGFLLFGITVLCLEKRWKIQQQKNN